MPGQLAGDQLAVKPTPEIFVAANAPVVWSGVGITGAMGAVVWLPFELQLEGDGEYACTR